MARIRTHQEVKFLKQRMSQQRSRLKGATQDPEIEKAKAADEKAKTERCERSQVFGEGDTVKLEDGRLAKILSVDRVHGRVRLQILNRLRKEETHSPLMLTLVKKARAR